MGKYSPITKWLSEISCNKISLTFSDVESILGFKLPESAYKHSRWWMNDINHSQAKGWIDAGFITANYNQAIASKAVVFEKGAGTKNSNCDEAKVTPQLQTTIAANIEVEIEKDLLSVDLGANGMLSVNNYDFIETPFKIYAKDIPSPFLQYDGHPVNELLCKRQYSSLRVAIEKHYPQFLNMSIKSFMTYLVQCGDPFYLKFLNKNGQDNFCRFELTDEAIYPKRGLYLYVYNGEIRYIGRCRDNFYKRFNINYGNIAPINCYKEGQSTNTHMNSLMNTYGENIKIYICPLMNVEEIENAEDILIKQVQPAWNRKK
jgi:hypothetical protein